jgi:hypothetical protein
MKCFEWLLRIVVRNRAAPQQREKHAICVPAMETLEPRVVLSSFGGPRSFDYGGGLDRAGSFDPRTGFAQQIEFYRPENVYSPRSASYAPFESPRFIAAHVWLPPDSAPRGLPFAPAPPLQPAPQLLIPPVSAPSVPSVLGSIASAPASPLFSTPPSSVDPAPAQNSLRIVSSPFATASASTRQGPASGFGQFEISAADNESSLSLRALPSVNETALEVILHSSGLTAAGQAEDWQATSVESMGDNASSSKSESTRPKSGLASESDGNGFIELHSVVDGLRPRRRSVLPSHAERGRSEEQNIASRQHTHLKAALAGNLRPLANAFINSTFVDEAANGLIELLALDTLSFAKRLVATPLRSGHDPTLVAEHVEMTFGAMVSRHREFEVPEVDENSGPAGPPHEVLRIECSEVRAAEEDRMSAGQNEGKHPLAGGKVVN